MVDIGTDPAAGAPSEVQCDRCGRRITIPPAKNFKAAIRSIKLAGWKNLAGPKGWRQVCPTCLDDEEEALREKWSTEPRLEAIESIAKDARSFILATVEMTPEDQIEALVTQAFDAFSRIILYCKEQPAFLEKHGEVLTGGPEPAPQEVPDDRL